MMGSTCAGGELLADIYATQGGEADLKDLGVISASGMPSVKPRIELVLARSSGGDTHGGRLA